MKKPDETQEEIKVVEMAPLELKPLFVSAGAVDQIILGVSKKTFSNWRSLKVGPKYYMVGGKPYYRFDELDEFFGANPVMTSGVES